MSNKIMTNSNVSLRHSGVMRVDVTTIAVKGRGIDNEDIEDLPFLSTQYESNVRILNKNSASFCSTAAAGSVDFTALLLLAPAAFACCGTGTKDINGLSESFGCRR